MDADRKERDAERAKMQTLATAHRQLLGLGIGRGILNYHPIPSVIRKRETQEKMRAFPM
jgi:hypothetical protein